MANLRTNASVAAESTLSSSLAAGATTVDVADTSAFSAVPFYATIEAGNDSNREVVLVDGAKTATTFTLSAASSRGQDGTSDVSHPSGASIKEVPTAAHLNDLHDRVDGRVESPSGLDTSTGLVAGDGSGGTELVGRDTWVARGDGATASVAANESTTSTSPTDLTTVGPEVTVSLDEAREVLVVVSAQLRSATDSFGAFMHFAVSGATTRAFDIEEALAKYGTEWARASAVALVTLNAGTNTLTAKYQSSSTSHAASFLRRNLTVIPL